VWRQARSLVFLCALCFPLKISFDNIERTELSYHLFQIEDMCGTTKAAAVPVIPDSEGNQCFIIFHVSTSYYSVHKELKEEHQITCLLKLWHPFGLGYKCDTAA
jgi:hypothetical protein